MTVSAQTARSGPYAGAGGTGPFAYGFKILDETHLVVTKTSAAGVDTVLTLTADYTVTGVGEDSGGNVTTVANVESGEKLTITRSVPKVQAADLLNLGGTQPVVLEDALDKLTQILQDLTVITGRTITLETTSTLSDITLPEPGADEYIRWNSGGTALETAALVTTDATLPLSIANGGTASTTEADARTALGLALPLALASGGTGATTASGARTSLELENGALILHKRNATVAPNANHDSDDGYGVGSLWLDVTNDEAYVCVDATVGAAVWPQISPAGAAIPTGTVSSFLRATAPSGWLSLNGDTMGSASSSSTQASDLNEDLFTLLFDDFADAESPILTSAGAGTTRVAQTDAATAWAANCRITLPDATGRAIFGLEASATRLTAGGSGVDGATLGETGGDQLTQSHSHSQTIPSGTTDIGADGSGLTVYGSGGSTTGPFGSGGSQNMPPALVLLVCVKL